MHDPTGIVELHLLHAHVAIIDQISRQLHTPPLVARCGWQVVHQRALLGEEAEHVRMPTNIHQLLDQLHHFALGFAHPHNDVRAKFLRPEDVAGVLQYLPVFRPGMRRLHALSARAIEQLGCGGIQRDREDVGTVIAQDLHIVAGHRGGIGQDRDRYGVRIDSIGPALEHRDRVLVRARMGDHRNTHPMERRTRHIAGHDINHLIGGHRRPIDADEIAVRIVTLGLAVSGKAAVRAVGATPFRIGQ